MASPVTMSSLSLEQQNLTGISHPDSDSSGGNNSSQPDLQYPVTQNEYNQFQIPGYTFALVTTFSSLIFLVGILGNLVVMFIILRNRDMRNATNMCLLSLSAADMLVLCVCMPSALIEFYGKDVWYLGEVLCEFVFFFAPWCSNQNPTKRKVSLHRALPGHSCECSCVSWACFSVSVKFSVSAPKVRPLVRRV